VNNPRLGASKMLKVAESVSPALAVDRAEWRFTLDSRDMPG